MTLEDLYRLLRLGHVQAQGIVDTLDEPLLVLDQSLCVVSANLAFLKAFAVERDDTVGSSLFSLGNGQWDIPELRKLLGEIIPKATAVVGYEVSHDFPGIGQRTFLVSARKLVHPDNNSTQMLLVFSDVTQSRHEAEQKDIVLAETRHRMKNLLGVVRALANQTQVDGRTAREYRDIFLGRFEALLTAQELSFSESGTDLATVAGQSLRPFIDRARIGPGPKARLAASQVLPLGMIFHELATNATKYGALSVPEGLVHVEWSIEPEVEPTTLRLVWREEKGPRVSPPDKTGFGSRLIEFNAKNDLGAEMELDFDPAGLVARFAIPLA